MGKIFLAADGSDHSRRALTKAIQLAKASDASIDIVHVVSAKESKEAALNSTGKIDLETKRKRMMQPLFDTIEAEGIAYEYVELRGEPDVELVKYANRDPFEYVVVGSRGLNTFQEFVLGSVSHKLAKRAQAPVIIVK
ncbi:MULTISPECIES: universal stress protein [unclassified Exiguobacterium]|uniref:universal stress protein n=1 Tax=unclassified Exiguobacterium TaxID=2644629 RepID=UPI00103C586F|nr:MULTISPECIES: universal stress protein [unclassified Exiguobacterium]TCI39176.1 universal stress protein [Exiguobacterium sp. SH4S7]TCI48139.1 universal stress protein [Exiguobacterium sp. SH5S32]TCI51253.1 universal stress protein [Exiguobacterium sp. SH5S13]TCI55024.1 universal stress protein [Exiguobacterium sp. SH1S4]TCI57309.1 universal stress protein [Exiguobacterium sp. SH1S21]